MDTDVEGKIEVRVSLNEKKLLVTLALFSFGLILGGILAYLFSTTIITILLSLIFGLTCSILLCYFVLKSSTMFYAECIQHKKTESDEEFTSMMKIE